MPASSDRPVPAATAVDLLPAVARGDERALDALWQRYSGRVRAMGLRLSGYDHRFADDLVQEAFAKLWRGAGSFDPSRGTEATFVLTVARRAATDQWRRTRRLAGDQPLERVPPSVEIDLDAHRAPERRIDADHAAGLVSAALDRLPPAQREVIELAYFHHLSQREIADRLDIPIGTVKTRTHAAMRSLRGALHQQRDGLEEPW